MTSALNQFRESVVYESTTTFAGWQTDVAAIARLDARAERLRRQWFWTNVVLGVVLVACIAVTLEEIDALPRGFTGVLLGFPAVLLVGGLLRQATVKKLDVENRRYELVTALLKLLHRDMERDAQLFIRLDLLPADHRGKDRKRFESNGWDVVVYNDAWLTLRGRLQDGARFSLTVRDHLQNRRRWKRTGSKSKLKTKQKQGLSATLKLKLDGDALGRLEAAAARAPALKLPPGATMEPLRMEEGAAVLDVYVQGRWSAEPGEVGSGLDLLALMFVGLYQLAGAPGAGARTP